MSADLNPTAVDQEWLGNPEATDESSVNPVIPRRVYTSMLDLPSPQEHVKPVIPAYVSEKFPYRRLNTKTISIGMKVIYLGEHFGPWRRFSGQTGKVFKIRDQQVFVDFGEPGFNDFPAFEVHPL